jgi:hypothetical protein
MPLKMKEAYTMENETNSPAAGALAATIRINSRARNKTPADYAAFTAAVLKKECEDGTLPLLPNPVTGLVDTSPVYNIMDLKSREYGTVLAQSKDTGPDGKAKMYNRFTKDAIMTLLAFKAHQGKYGLSSGEYISRESAIKAGIKPVKDSFPCDLPITEKDSNGSFQTTVVNMYNVEQFENPDAAREFAAKSFAEKKAETISYLMEQGADSSKVATEMKKHTMNCTNVPFASPDDPSRFASEYLAQYCACVREHVYMKVSQADAVKFKKALVEELSRDNRDKRYNLPDFCSSAVNNANNYAHEIYDFLKNRSSPSPAEPAKAQAKESWPVEKAVAAGHSL